MERTRTESDGLGTLISVAGDDKLIDVAKNTFKKRCVTAALQIYPDGSRKYDTMKLLQIAEIWFKDLHRTDILPNLFVGAFLASMPDDLLVDLTSAGMKLDNACVVCKTRVDEPIARFIPLRRCFCGTCARGLYYSTSWRVEGVPTEGDQCKCGTNYDTDVILCACDQLYCTICRKDTALCDETEV